MSLTRMATIAALSTALIATAASAETFREHFMTSWDLDGNGAITLQEVQERRDGMFAAFDTNEDGYLDTTERKAMGEMRDAEQASMAEEGIERPGMGAGKGHGQAMGQGMGQGHGMGRGKGMQMAAGMGQGHGAQQGGMMNASGDGRIGHDDFVGMSKTWLARFDANGDGEISQADF